MSFVWIVLQLSLSRCVDALMVFGNSHLMMNHLNKLAFISAHSNARFVRYSLFYSLNSCLSKVSLHLYIPLEFKYILVKNV